MIRWTLPLAFAAAAVAADDPHARAVDILRTNCGQCHSKTTAMSGLDLSTREAAIKGGSRGAAVVPGDAAASKLIQAVERKGGLAMPPAKALAPAEVEALRAWVAGGAKWVDGAGPAVQSTWWSFQKPKRAEPPKSGDAWARNAIDEFVLAKLRANSLKPAAEASRATLIRRAYFDLTGLPPAAAEVREFVNDKSPDAWSKIVERLLASKHYGEKWGRHWLDLARYSDTAGFELDSYIHDAFRYRDWVIDALNKDKPYDRFLREQIAGDEVDPENPSAVSGTGFYCVGPNRDLFPDQSDINREEILTDYVDTTSSAFLGLTAGCARCHDHKFDPIPQADYYRVRALFAPAQKVPVPLNRLGSLGNLTSASNREWKLREIGDNIRVARGRCSKALFEQKLKPLAADVQEALRLNDDGRTEKQREIATLNQDKVRVTDDEIRACMTPDETASLHAVEKRLVAMYANFSPHFFACGLGDVGDHAPKTFVPERGGRPKKEVEPGFFSILGGGDVGPPPVREATGPIPLLPSTGRRLALANWIATADNPLTARVAVNRIWQHHFGRGIVATPSDFGTRGRLPTHPELLDWLATEFIARGWSVKAMHRLMLESAAYRQSSAVAADALARDPENLWLSHFSRRRLDADEIRDATLAVAGTLNRKGGGRPVVPTLSAEELQNLTQRPDDAWVVTADKREHARRAIYMIQKRTFRLPMMEVFDAPDSMLTCPRRESSTSAPQSLTRLNGGFGIEQSRTLAAELRAKSASDAALVDAAWERVLLRAPEAEEKRLALEFLAKQAKITGSADAAAFELIRGMLNVNEFLYVD